LSARLWLAFCIRGLVVIVAFFVVLGVISMGCFVAFIVFAVGFGAFVVNMVFDNAVIVGAFCNGWGMIVRFIVVAVSGGRRLLVIL